MVPVVRELRKIQFIPVLGLFLFNNSPNPAKISYYYRINAMPWYISTKFPPKVNLIKCKLRIVEKFGVPEGVRRH